MAEAEDVITDVARHATVFVQDLWRRRRSGRDENELDLPQLLHRLDLVITGVFQEGFQFRVAQPPPHTPLLRKLFRSYEQPSTRNAAPATDGASIWLPAPLPGTDPDTVVRELRVMALQQAARARRAASQVLHDAANPLERSLFEVLEADAADADLKRLLGGLAGELDRFRRKMLETRPPLQRFPPTRRPLEQWVREIMVASHPDVPGSHRASTAADSLRLARELAPRVLDAAHSNALIAGLLFRDGWTGELRPAARTNAHSQGNEPADNGARDSDHRSPRSARLARRPKVREADERDEKPSAGAWMVQTAQPNESAEDPYGLQRPTDRDESTAAEEFADSVSELAEARLVTTPGAPKEVLISDDPPEASARAAPRLGSIEDVLTYPEWDWRAGGYREPGAAVHLLEAEPGPREWITRTLDEHRGMLNGIRRQFESLRAERVRLRQQLDGDDLDLEACIDGFADARTGVMAPPGLYQTMRTSRREMAVLLLIDVSGSTDGWASSARRVIDVEREALLLVCLALESLGEPYSVLAFSGDGPAYVTVRSVKTFAEPYADDVALRIAGLEPERFTRAGAAIRHASALLMRQPARHRLLLMLSDGKPNDVDEYDGRYGVEDMRQSVTEARLQGIFPFCLTIDRQTANYLPAVFGEHQYSVLHRPELLPTALLGWLRRLVASC